MTPFDAVTWVSRLARGACRVLAARGGACRVLGARGPTTGDRGDGVDRGDADQPIHDPAGRVRAAELLAKNPGDKVEPSDRHQTPVEPTHDQQGPGEHIELTRCCLPPVEELFGTKQ